MSKDSEVFEGEKDNTPPIISDDKKVAETPEQVKLEQAARAKGWKPKEEYEGEGWVGAEEFLNREPLFDRIKQQSKDIRELRKTIDAMASHFKKATESAVNQAIANLKNERKEAIQTGDVEKVEAIDQQIEEQKQIKADHPTKQDVKPEIAAWVEKNQWFNTDQELADFAIAYNNMQLSKGISLADALENTAKAVKKAFPDKFNKNAGRQTAPPPVESPTGTQVKGDKKYTVGRLSADQKRVYDQMVTRNKIMTHEEYFKGLEEIGELA